MSLNDDYKDMLSALKDAGAEHLIVGAYALAAYGNPRATGDIDIWVRPTEENAAKVWKAVVAFGAPRREINQDDFALRDTIYQIGLPPNRIDIITSIDGVEFEEAWPLRQEADFDGFTLEVIGRNELVANKRAAGRPKDLADVHWLERMDKQK
jgi:hypothetical protein